MKYSFEVIADYIVHKYKPHIRNTKNYQTALDHVSHVTFKGMNEEAIYEKLYKRHIEHKALFIRNSSNDGYIVNEAALESWDIYYTVALNDVYQRIKKNFFATKPIFSTVELKPTQAIHPSMAGVRFGRAYLVSSFGGQMYYFVGFVSAFDYHGMVALNVSYEQFKVAHKEASVIITDPAGYIINGGHYYEQPGYGIWVSKSPACNVGCFYAEEFARLMSQQFLSCPNTSYNYLQ